MRAALDTATHCPHHSDSSVQVTLGRARGLLHGAYSRVSLGPNAWVAMLAAAHARGTPRRAHFSLHGQRTADTETKTLVQLSAYSLTAMRVCGEINAPFAPAVACGVAAFVKLGAVSGREFLFLAGADLNHTRSHTALLSASRGLRQRVLRRRIQGSASPAGLARVYTRVSSFCGSALSLDSRVHLETGHLRCARSGRMFTMTHCVGARIGSECDAPPASPVIDEFRPEDAALL